MMKRFGAIILVFLFFIRPVSGQGSVSLQTGKHQESVDLLVRYLKIDTSNPPGNEIGAAQFFGEIFAKEGIEYRILESAPGRGNIWARVRGDGSKRPVILLNHLDVVPAYSDAWTSPPFGAIERDGFIVGRGALDMKSLAIAQLMVMLRVKRERVALSRDLIFLGTADEEAGGRQGAEWMVTRFPELLDGAEYLLNEGGGNLVQSDGRVLAIGLSTVEKTPAWLRLTANGTPGHASVPRQDSAVNRLVKALDRLIRWSPPLKVTTAVAQYYQSLAPLFGPQDSQRYRSIRHELEAPDFRQMLDSDPAAKALFQNTISVTMLEGSNKINVIPPFASARVDCRLLPGEKVDLWIREVAAIIGDERISIEPILSFEAVASPVESQMTEMLREVIGRRYPGAVVTFPVTLGFTDSHYFRRLGVKSYGFSPFIAPPQMLGDGFHGNDERIGRQVFVEGVEIMYQLLEPLIGRH